jgi:MFS family permease
MSIRRGSSRSPTSELSTYQAIQISSNEVDSVQARRTLINFVAMSILFSLNHGCAVSCLSLATARLGSVGAWQSGLLYLSYTGTALLGATYVVKRLGARNALAAGMGAYVFYVAAFWIATVLQDEQEMMIRIVALTGAAIGGVGAGFLWTAQGSYFACAAEEHAQLLGQPKTESTAMLAGIFAFIYLLAEVVLRSLSSVLLELWSVKWSTIFCVYLLITILSTVLMLFLVRDYNDDDDEEEEEANSSTSSVWYKVTAALRLIRTDSKMKYMIAINMVFGFTWAFLNGFFNGEVVPIVLNDADSKYLGLLTSGMATVASILSLVFARLTHYTGKVAILILGASSCLFIALMFLVQPAIETWTLTNVIVVYVMQGVGRATFEGTLKALFADYFAYEKAAGYANIILWNGLSGAIGYVMTFSLLCSTQSTYCIEYKDGSLHNVITFELLIVVFSILAILGVWKASSIHQASLGTSSSTDESTGATPAEEEEEAFVVQNDDGQLT